VSDSTERELRAEFERADADQSGDIDEDEFARLVAALGVTFTPEQVQTAFLAIDINGNRRIEFGEFKSWWGKRG
jgi:Ca2+-binding EF-hand superfamily protein